MRTRLNSWAAVGLAVLAVGGCGNDHGIEDPGRVTLHRLNKVEYNNTVRDLLGTTLTPADDFPSDDRGYGFDNVADSLTLSPLQVELYDRAAEALIEDAFDVMVPAETKRSELETAGGTSGNADGDGWMFSSNGNATIPFEAKMAGTYRVRVRAGETHAGPDFAKMTVKVGSGVVKTFDVSAPRTSPATYEYTQALAAGTHNLVVAFTNDYYMPPEDRNLWIDYVEVTGPIGATSDPSKRDRILICDVTSGRACVEEVITKFARRAWRRLPTKAEVARLVELVDVATAEGDDAITGVKLALRGVLVSPNFVFRVEVDDKPHSLVPHAVSSFELASRLSYFAWSSMPDDELLDAAEAGKLEKPEQILAHLDRLLADPRASALTDNFAGQWLFTRALGDHVPDYNTFPAYDKQLEAAMRAETQRYFRAFLEDDIPMDQFLTANWTYANDRLAKHYGLPLPGTSELVKVSLDGVQRRGLLTQGSVLTVTSHPRRTSPVKRGKWLLDQILCAPPPNPPPGVEGLIEDEMQTPGMELTIRQRLEKHRENEYCASCHNTIDPLGFGLENFDGIGAWRTKEGNLDVDASGLLPDGQAFTGALDLANILGNDPRVYRCMVEKLYTYALGRPPTSRDAAAHIDDLTIDFTQRGFVLRDLIKSIVLHDAFRTRRGEP